MYKLNFSNCTVDLKVLSCNTVEVIFTSNNISNDNHKDRMAAQTNEARPVSLYLSRSLLLLLQPALSCPVQQEGLIGPVHMSTIVFAWISFVLLYHRPSGSIKVFIGKTMNLVRSTTGIYLWECWLIKHSLINKISTSFLRANRNTNGKCQHRLAR